MKTRNAFFFSLILTFFSLISFAQNTKSDTLSVAGVCGMCKKKIETSAKAAGAEFASWGPDSKKLVIRYRQAATNPTRVQQSVALAGYDTPEIKASAAAYNNLHECCKYERPASTTQMGCCVDGGCTKGDACCKEGTCKDTDCCKPGAECCKNGKCTKHTTQKA